MKSEILKSVLSNNTGFFRGFIIKEAFGVFNAGMHEIHSLIEDEELVALACMRYTLS